MTNISTVLALTGVQPWWHTATSVHSYFTTTAVVLLIQSNSFFSHPQLFVYLSFIVKHPHTNTVKSPGSLSGLWGSSLFLCWLGVMTWLWPALWSPWNNSPCSHNHTFLSVCVGMVWWSVCRLEACHQPRVKQSSPSTSCSTHWTMFAVTFSP